MAALDIDNITITDNYMFGTVFSDMDLCRELLEMALGVPIDHVELIQSERTQQAEIGAKGIRMDVYVADGKGTVFDVEIQNSNEGNVMKRSRFYISSNDYDCIAKGATFNKIHDSYVLFFCTFDPFSRKLPIYTVKPCCREDNTWMDDGTTRVFYNSTAWKACKDERMRAFLRYLDEGKLEGDDFSNRVDEAVRKTRNQPEWRRTRMKLEQYIAEEREKARDEGHKEGYDEGHKEGHEEGYDEGHKEGHEEGYDEGHKEGHDEGYDEGRKEAHDEEQRLNSALAAALVSRGREDEAVAAMLDPQVREKLLEELGIE